MFFHGYSAHGDLKSPPLSTQPGSPPMHLEGECWVVRGLGRAWGNQEVKGLAAKKPRHHYQHHHHRTSESKCQGSSGLQGDLKILYSLTLQPFSWAQVHPLLTFTVTASASLRVPCLQSALSARSMNKQCAGVAANTCPPSRLLLKDHTEWIEFCFYRKSCSYHPPPPAHHHHQIRGVSEFRGNRCVLLWEKS